MMEHSALVAERGCGRFAHMRRICLSDLSGSGWFPDLSGVWMTDVCARSQVCPEGRKTRVHLPRICLLHAADQ